MSRLDLLETPLGLICIFTTSLRCLSRLCALGLFGNRNEAAEDDEYDANHQEQNDEQSHPETCRRSVSDALILELRKLTKSRTRLHSSEVTLDAVVHINVQGDLREEGDDGDEAGEECGEWCPETGGIVPLADIDNEGKCDQRSGLRGPRDVCIRISHTYTPARTLCTKEVYAPNVLNPGPLVHWCLTMI